MNVFFAGFLFQKKANFPEQRQSLLSKGTAPAEVFFADFLFQKKANSSGQKHSLSSKGKAS